MPNSLINYGDAAILDIEHDDSQFSFNNLSK